MSLKEDNRWVVYCDICNPEQRTMIGSAWSSCGVTEYNKVIRSYGTIFDEKTGFFYVNKNFDAEKHGGTGTCLAQICNTCAKKIVENYAVDFIYNLIQKEKIKEKELDD